MVDFDQKRGHPSRSTFKKRTFEPVIKNPAQGLLSGGGSRGFDRQQGVQNVPKAQLSAGAHASESTPLSQKKGAVFGQKRAISLTPPRWGGVRLIRKKTVDSMAVANPNPAAFFLRESRRGLPLQVCQQALDRQRGEGFWACRRRALRRRLEKPADLLCAQTEQKTSRCVLVVMPAFLHGGGRLVDPRQIPLIGGHAIQPKLCERKAAEADQSAHQGL